MSEVVWTTEMPSCSVQDHNTAVVLNAVHVTGFSCGSWLGGFNQDVPCTVSENIGWRKPMTDPW